MKLRFYYLALWILIVVLGLGSRTYGDYLPSWVATYAGDTHPVLPSGRLLRDVR